MVKPESPYKWRIRFLRIANPYGEIDGANIRCFYSERSEKGIEMKLLNLNYMVISQRTTPGTIFKDGLYRKDLINDKIPHLINPDFYVLDQTSDDYNRRIIRAEIFRDKYFRERVLTEENAPHIEQRDFNLLFNSLRTSEYPDIYRLLNLVSERSENN